MSKRVAIIQLHRAGHSNSKIMKLLKAPKSTVREQSCASKNSEPWRIGIGVDDLDPLALQQRSRPSGREFGGTPNDP